MAKTVAGNIRTGETLESLPCEISATRRKEITEALLSGLDAIEELEDDKKSFADEFKERMEMLKGNVNGCRKALKVGDMQNVKVRTTLDYDTKEVIRERLDTFQEIERRPMSDKELQMTLPQA